MYWVITKCLFFIAL